MQNTTAWQQGNSFRVQSYTPDDGQIGLKI
jgi:hypothetical protein